MKKINLILFFFLILFESCNGSFNLYISQTRIDENEIVGHKLQEFFKGKRKIKKLKIKNKSLFHDEMQLIKDSLQKNKLLPKGVGLHGFYKYAFITYNDTLYANSSLKSWKYKNKVGFYENLSVILKEEIIHSE